MLQLPEINGRYASEDIVSHFRRVLRGKSYDEFFAARSRVSGIQFWGLLILGSGLIVGGLTTLAVMLSDVRPSQLLDLPGSLILLAPVGIFGGIAYLGVLYIKRALAGRRQSGTKNISHH